MTDSTTRRISLATVPNLRSPGGLPVSGGTTTPGLLFRSATLGGLSAADGEALADLGIRHVVDFRTAGERASAPDLLPPTIEGVHLDVLGDHAQDLAASLAHLGVPGTSGSAEQPGEPAQLAEPGEPARSTEPAQSAQPAQPAQPGPEQLAQAQQLASQIEELLGAGRGVKLLQESNRLMVSSDSARAAYGEFFAALARPGDFAPTLFHCTTGKDRTGWAAAALLLLLGADTATVLADYLQTNVDILPLIEPLLARAEQHGIDPTLLRPVLTVHESMLEAAIDEAETRYGSIEGYFTAGLGLGDDQIAALRDRFITAG